jgi:hypothetical protein
VLVISKSQLELEKEAPAGVASRQGAAVQRLLACTGTHPCSRLASKSGTLLNMFSGATLLVCTTNKVHTHTSLRRASDGRLLLPSTSNDSDPRRLNHRHGTCPAASCCQIIIRKLRTLERTCQAPVLKDGWCSSRTPTALAARAWAR